jgi:Predicted oxidoreductases (related to aryl-alcohol dehydrogenases)
MEYRVLGNTGLKVSRLCFGALTIGHMQANLSIEDGARVIVKAFDMGVNFIDTAKLYETYPYIRRAMEISGKRDIIISSKSYDYTYEGMKESVEEALRELNIESIGIFSLHEQESIYTLKGHRDALNFLVEAKKMGKIKAVGVSTHNVSVVEAISKMPEIDVVHPIVNYKGIGIGDGTIEDMLKAVEKAKSCGKGIYSMKPIGGGNLIGEVEKCFDFVLKNDNIDSIAVGMQSENEVIANISIFNGGKIPDDVNDRLRKTKRRLLIDTWCEGCGRCVERCTLHALSIKNNRCEVDAEKCRLCGYCSTVCPQFCIKVV